MYAFITHFNLAMTESLQNYHSKASNYRASLSNCY